MSDKPSAAAHDIRLIVFGSLLYVAGSTIFYMMPPYLAFIGARLSLDAGQLGTLAAVESLAIALASLAGPFWIGRFDRRAVIVAGTLAYIVGNAATVFAGDFNMVLAARFMAGLLGEGLLYTTSFAVLGAARNIDRAFAIALTAAVVYGAAVTVATGTIEALLPTVGPLAGLAVIAVAVFPFLGWLPVAQTAQPVASASSTRAWNWAAIIGLLAQAIWFGAPGAFWTFVEQVATDKGISTDMAEKAVSAGELFGLIGGVIAAWLGDRMGRSGPIVIATAGVILSAIAYQLSDGALALAIFLAVFYSFWNYGCVYQMSFVSTLDPSGRAGVTMPAAQVFGLSFGPYCTGQLMLTHGDGAVTAATVAFASAGLGLYLVCFARVRRPALA